MVAIVSGAGLGLFNSSANTFGSSADLGPMSPGRNGENISVNVATGNLVLQDRDERLASLGVDFALVRTYNSLGVVDGDNNDNWRVGVYQRLSNLTGTRNTTGSTITKTFGDGTDVVYTWNSTRSRYESTAGDGAHDFLVWNGTTSRWTWTDGSARNIETYDWTGSGTSAVGKILNSKDTDGNTSTYAYTGTLLTSVTDASGQQTFLDYSGNNLTQIRVVSSGVTQTLTRYRYDASNRLRQVIVDLTPADNTAPLPDANGDGLIETTNGQTYITTYTYVGTTKQIASITQSDGSSVSFTYVSLNGQNRLQTVVVNDGTTNRTTTFGYTSFSTANGGVYLTTNVTDPLNRVTTYNQDASGRLISVLSPTTGGSRIQTNYGYDASGNLTSVTEDPTGLNRITTNNYDANGNLTLTRDSAGNTVTRTYDANNQLVSETQYLVRDPDGAGTGQPSSPLTTNYVYDSESHLRFVISSDGRVTEHQYDAPGKRILTRRFQGGLYTSTTFTESALQTWAGSQDLTKLERLDYAYDFRAQVSSITAWSATTSAGAGSGTPSITRFTYDQRGQLLNTTDARGEATTSDATDYVTSYTYDGLGRVLTTTEWMAAGKTRVTTNQYDDLGNRTVTSSSNGLVTTSVYNKAGELVSVTSGASAFSATANNAVLSTTDTVNQVYNVNTTALSGAANYVQGNSSAPQNALSSISVTYTGAQTAGDLNVIAIAFDDSVDSITSVTDSRGNVYTRAAGPTVSSGNATAAIYYAKNIVSAAAGANTVTVQFSAAVWYPDLRVAEYSGVDTVNPFDGANGASGNGTAMDSGAITTTNANDLLVGTTYLSSQTSAPGSGYTQRLLTNPDSSILEDRLVTASGSYSASATQDQAGWWVMQVAAFRSAPPYYLVPSGATWQSVANALYGVNSAAAGSALQSALGNPALTAGAHLTNLPATLTVGTQQTVPAYYVVKAGDTWNAITQTIYGTSDPRAVAALQTQTGNPALTTGLHLTVPLTLNYSDITTGTTTYKYDADNNLLSVTDPTGVVSYSVYDESGRKTGEVDGTGTLTEYVYNKADQVVKTVCYATAVSSAALSSLAGNTGALLVANIRPTATAADQITRTVYNNAGQVQYTIDAAGAVTETVCDGAGRTTDVVDYANPVNISASTGEVLPGSFTITADSANDRRTRYFYNNDGELIGTLDGMGYLSESLYDAAGHLTQTIQYANQVPSASRAGTFAQLKAAAGTDNETTTDPEQDAATYFFYDGQGRQIGSLDAEGYLSETQYDVAGNASQSLRYDPYNTSGGRVVLTYSAGTTFQNLKNTATAAFVVYTHSVSYQYDGIGNVISETTTQGSGSTVDTVTTTYQYDNAGNLISKTLAQGTSDARTTQARYDALGRITQELSGEGTKALTALGASPTQAQIDQVWDRYGIKYQYDAAGRKVSVTTVAFDLSNNTTQPSTTYLYYDADGQLRFAVNALGEVTESRYNTLGQLTDVLTYANRISTAGLAGGLVTSALATQLTPAADSTHDARVTYTYEVTGNVDTVTTKLNATDSALTTYDYNAFGEEKLRSEKIDATRTRTTTSTYDQRGLLTTIKSDTTGFNLTTSQTYDAFGRVNSTTDAMGRVSKVEYDRLGRTVATVDTLTNRRKMTYDAFDRVLTTRDALSNVTSYSYNDASRAMTVRTPEGVSVTTTQTREGETLSVTANGNTTTYQYNANGQVISASDSLGTLESHVYDSAGREVTETDGKGALTRLSYDAANRVLTRAVDPSGINLVTSYQYDGQGRVTQVTEPTGRITRTDYDNSGRVTQVAIDPAGLNLRTQYTYDPEDRTLTVVEGAGGSNPRTTQYTYDTLGRRTQEVVDPGTGKLNLTTQYKYDNNGNLTRKIDARGASTWYLYDAANRVTTTITASGANPTDPTGILTQVTYDAENRLLSTRTYKNTISTSGFGDVLTSVTLPATDVLDHYNQTVYDKDGRAVYDIDALGAVTERTFDADSNVTRTRAYEKRVASGTYTTVSATQSALTSAGNSTSTVSANDRVTYGAYDARDRLAFAVDGAGGVTQYQYDGNGNVTQTTLYATARASGAMDLASLNSFASSNAGNAKNQTTKFWYDAADRNRFTLDADGYLSETRYNDAIRETRAIVYNKRDANNVPVKPSVPAGATLAQVVSSAAAVASSSQDEVTITVTDAVGRLSRVTDAMGGVTVYGYDNAGNLQTVTDANNNVTTNTFDAAWRLKTVLTPNGVLTTNSYDALGNLITKTTAWSDGSDARTTSYIYDALGRQTRITDGEGFSTSIVYDTFGNQTSVTSGQYLLTSGQAGYDANKAARAATPDASTFTYDARDQLVLMSDGESNVTVYNYDTFGNRTGVTEAAFSTAEATSYTYDGANRVLTVTNALGGQTKYQYDTAGNKIIESVLQSGTVSSGVWINRSFEYTKKNQLSATIDPYTTRDERYYDAAGNLLEIRYAAGSSDQRSVKMEYDQDNRKSADVSYDTQGNLTNRTLYAYDKVGNRIKVTKPADAKGYVAVTHYYYNKDNQLTTVLDPTGAINTFKYDSAGNQTEARVYLTAYTGAASDTTPPTPTTSANDRISTNVYDRASRVSSHTDPDGTRTDYTYDGVGKMLTEKLYANTTAPRTRTYIYDRNGRLKTFTDVDSTQTAYTYDGAGNKTSEILTNSADTQNPARRTYFKYDLNNRLTQEIFDPNTDPYTGATLRSGGLNIIKTRTYDQAGNLLSLTINSRIDAGSGVDSYTYDLDNRQSTHTDGMNDTTRFGYDRVGNQTSVTDARNNTTNYVYDLNNRLKQTILPPVTVYTIAGGEFTGARPTTTNTYDNAGNLVQVTDANGNKTTRYYDGNGHVIAELKGNNALCEYAYSTAGQLVTKTEYMTFFAASAQNPAVRPSGPAGEVRATTYQYDLAGRLTQVTLPAVEVTTLGSTGTSLPTVASRTTMSLTERHVYNAFGDEVETYDRAGNRTLHYYDVKHREVATVDSMGYLVEHDYDAQDNVLAKRQYMTAIANPGSLTSSARPAAPGGTVNLTNWVYDAASRVTAEVDPLVDVDVPSPENPSVPGVAQSVRPATTYTYDSAGNLRSKTTAAGMPNQQVEYYYYDGAGRKIGMVDNARVLTLYTYDAANNLTGVTRYYGTVPTSVNLATAAFYDTIVTNVANNANYRADLSEQKTFTYDAANRIVSQTDAMSPGTTADDLTQSYKYDGNGNRTWVTDEDGYKTTTAYNAAGQVTRTVIPNGMGSLFHYVGTNFEYDAVGNLTRTYTGDSPNMATAATGVTATLTDGVAGIDFMAAAGNAQAYIVFDTASRSSPDSYAQRSATQTVPDGGGSLHTALPNLKGGKYYFRIVTVDSAGNMASTAEQTFVQPAKITKIDLGFHVNAWNNGIPDFIQHFTLTFDSAVVNPHLMLGYPGADNVNVALTQQPDGTYYAEHTRADCNEYVVQWSDAFGNTYTSPVQPLFGGYGEVDLLNTTSQSAVSGGYQVTTTVTMPTDAYWGFTAMKAQWVKVDDASVNGSVTVPRPAASGGNDVYTLTLGSGAPLVAGTYRLQLFGIDHNGMPRRLDDYQYTVGTNGSGTITQQSYSWNSSRGDQGERSEARLTISTPDETQFFAADYASMDDLGRFVTHMPVLAPGSAYEENITYGHSNVETHSLTVTSSTPGAASTNLTFTLTVNPNEVARINAGGIQFFMNNVQNGSLQSVPGTDVTGVLQPSATPGVYTFTATNVPSGRVVFFLYYTDAEGHFPTFTYDYATYHGNYGVVLNTNTVSTAYSGRSFVEYAYGDYGSITRNTSGVLGGYVTPYVNGDVGVNQPTGTSSLALGSTGLGGGSRLANGLQTGYFIESKYDALNNKIASNGPDGLYREFGFDKNGNIVETRLYGIGDIAHYHTYALTDTSTTDSVITTFATYDARNRKTADWGGFMTVGGSLTRAVNRYGYDALNNVTSKLTDASATPWTYTYNAYGWLLTETNSLNGVTTHRYDVFGHETKVQTPRGGVTLKFYDAQGNLAKVHDAIGNETGYGYDFFNRKVSETDGRGMATSGNANDYTTLYTYDNRDRLISAQDADAWHVANDSAAIYAAERQALGFSAAPVVDPTLVYKALTTTYQYDGRNNRTVATRAAGTTWARRTVTTYDPMSRPVEESQEGFPDSQGNYAPIQDRMQRYDDYGNLIVETDGEGRHKDYVYGPFGRLSRQIDADSYQAVYLYDNFGRLMDQFSTFDPQLGLVGGNGDVGQNIHRTYDDAGHLLTVQDFTTGVSTTYTYDRLGNRKTEVITTPIGTDGKTHGRNITYTYDALNQMTRWVDSLSGAAENVSYDADGNRTRVWDDGINPAASLGGTSTYQRLDRTYTFDLAEHVKSEVNNVNGQTIASYDYDAAGNRRLDTEKLADGSTVTWNYIFDANDQVASGSGSNGTNRSWTYDPSANILTYKTYTTDANNPVSSSRYTYNNGQTLLFSHQNGTPDSVTTMQYDRAGWLISTSQLQGNSTLRYDYEYYSDGREARIIASGAGSGTTTVQYDVNKIRVHVDKGQTTGKTRKEVENFIVDNEGHILFKDHDDGASATHETREYFYANGQPVGEFGKDVDNKTRVIFDDGMYHLVHAINDDLPGAVGNYVVRAGDTLQGIASLFYGNPSLWFVIADANHLDSSQPLKEGTSLIIPSTVQTGTITAANHAVYSEAGITDSLLPNVAFPPPKRPSTCGAIAAIIITVIVAVVVSIASYGTASGLAAALGGGVIGSVLGGAAVGVVVGTVIAGVGLAATALLKYGTSSVPEDVALKTLAGGAIGGAIGGAGNGLLTAAGGVSASAWVHVANAGIQAFGGGVQQLVTNGRITNISGIVGAGISGGFGGSTIGNINAFVSPWAVAVESMVRNHNNPNYSVVDDVTSAISATAIAAAPYIYDFFNGLFSPDDNVGRRAYQPGSLRGDDLVDHRFDKRVSTEGKPMYADNGDINQSGSASDLGITNVPGNATVRVHGHIVSSDQADEILDASSTTDEGFSRMIGELAGGSSDRTIANYQSSAGNLPIEVGGDLGTIDPLRAAVDAVANTNRGRELFDMLAARGQPTYVVGTNQQEAASADIENGIISINPNYHPYLVTADGYRPASTAVVLAHELGHVATGRVDDGTNQMGNIIRSENPIRHELGLPYRTAYDGTLTDRLMTNYVLPLRDKLTSPTAPSLNLASPGFNPVGSAGGQALVDLMNDWMESEVEGAKRSLAEIGIDLRQSPADPNVHLPSLGQRLGRLGDLAVGVVKGIYDSMPHAFTRVRGGLGLGISVLAPPEQQRLPLNVQVNAGWVEDDQPNSNVKNVGFLTRNGWYQKDGKYYDSKTNKELTQTPWETRRSTIPQNNVKHLNSASVDMNIRSGDYGAQIIDPLFSHSANSSSLKGFTRLGEMRFESMYAMNVRLRALSTVDPRKSGYGTKPNIIDTPFIDMYGKAELMYAESKYNWNPGNFFGPKATDGFVVNSNLGSSIFALSEWGIRVKSGSTPANGPAPNRYAQTPTAIVEASLLKYHLDFATPRGAFLDYAYAGFGFTGDVNFRNAGFQVGMGPVETSNGAKFFREIGLSQGSGIRTTFSMNLQLNRTNIGNALSNFGAWMGNYFRFTEDPNHGVF